MRTIFKLILTAIIPAMLLISCDNTEETKPPVRPVADFEPEKSPFDVGDTVRLINKSENAVQYRWIIGAELEESYEKHPELIWEVPSPALGLGKTVVLLATSEDGLTDSTAKHVRMSMRFLYDVIVDELPDENLALLAGVEDETLELYAFLSHVNDPSIGDMWKNEQTTAKKTIDPKNIEFPVELYYPRTFPTIAMADSQWFFEIRAMAASWDEPKVLQRFEAAPSRVEAFTHQGSLRYFPLSNGQSEIRVAFGYWE
jgi:hypothetical protein